MPTRSTRSTTTDFLVIGGGVVGVSLARELRSRFSRATITLLEKEQACGLHASGRNSGVLHAGFYYTADSLKARYTRDGNRALTEFCRERKLRLNQCGKLVVARDERDLAGFDELLKRGKANGVEVHEVDEGDARGLEPLARTHRRALWSPTTSAVDPVEVLNALVTDAETRGVRVLRGVAYRGRRGGDVLTSQGAIAAGFVVNAAGLHADRIAHDFGFGLDYSILPFKGLYLYADSPFPLQRHVYPVPDLTNPFLGVHFTVTADSKVKIGPTAIPAFWREQYQGMSGFAAGEFFQIMRHAGQLFARNEFNFRGLAVSELRKYSRDTLVKLAQELVPSARAAAFARWGRAGIRAQLLDIKRRRLVMDFKYEGDDRSLHVLNAVSPAFTCAIPFAKHLVDTIESPSGAARPAMTS